MIIWIASFPRSGNTMYRMLVHQLTGIETYAPVNDALLQHDSDLLEMIGHKTLPARLPSAKEIRRGQQRPNPIVKNSRTYLVKTHARANELPYEASAVYIVRDGRDALVSFAHYQLTAKWGKTPEDYIPRLRRIVQNCRWGEHVTGWLHKARVVIHFEDMLADPVGVVADSLSVLGLDMTINLDVEIPTFDELRAHSGQFFRRGQVGSYRDEMPAEVEADFWTRHGAGMIAAGYER